MSAASSSCNFPIVTTKSHLINDSQEQLFFIIEVGNQRTNGIGSSLKATISEMNSKEISLKVTVETKGVKSKEFHLNDIWVDIKPKDLSFH